MISFNGKNKVNLQISFEDKVTSLTLRLVVHHKELIFNEKCFGQNLCKSVI